MNEAILAIIVNLSKDRKVSQPVGKCISMSINNAEYVKYALENGYLRISTPMENIDTATLKNVKLALKESGLKQAGEKDEIRKRLKEQGNIEVINRIFTNDSYKLTEKGEQLLKDKEYAIFYDNYLDLFYPNISLRDLEYKVLTEKKEIQQAVEELIEEAKKNKKFLYDDIVSSEIMFYKDLMKWDKYIEKLFLYCYMKLSGCIYGSYSESYSKIPEYESIALKNIQYELNYSNEKMKELYYIGIKDYNLKMKRFSDEEVFNLIMKSLEEGHKKINEEINIENAEVLDIETGRNKEEVRKEQFAKLGLKYEENSRGTFIGKIKKFFGF